MIFIILFFISCGLQILVQAADSGVPALFDLETVVITVNRNLNPPVFVRNVYQVEILETRNLGDTIETVRATDSDLVVSNFKHIHFFVKMKEILWVSNINLTFK